MRRFLLASLVLLANWPAFAAERWETLPPTPASIASDRGGHAQVNGISIYYAVYGHGSPVIFLHGGLANTDYLGNQVPEIA
ncbi:MAG TPA: alpha/beta hydrolase, partial [Bradyrhizobium sp.]